jgi:23S rRNA pseudouridine1911/1915/1917 synthase
MEPSIIYENDNILVLNKPAGFIVNNADTTKGQRTIQNWLEDNFSFPIFSNPDLRAGIVHRLDKETSGVLIVAKKEDVMLSLQSEFKERKVSKKYLALVHGQLTPPSGVVAATVGRLPWNRRRFGVLPGGRDSETEYKTQAIYKNDSGIYSLVELSPKTGRTHQIRIHMKYLGHPVVADVFYAGRKTSRKDLKWCPRLFLHAYYLKIKIPEIGFKEFKAPLSPDLQGVLNNLQVV